MQSERGRELRHLVAERDGLEDQRRHGLRENVQVRGQIDTIDVLDDVGVPQRFDALQRVARQMQLVGRTHALVEREHRHGLARSAGQGAAHAWSDAHAALVLPDASALRHAL